MRRRRKGETATSFVMSAVDFNVAGIFLKTALCGKLCQTGANNEEPDVLTLHNCII